ncbi:TPA: WecB/TagA/CpsF family glycosyltransferase [Bacillus cereus]
MKTEKMFNVDFAKISLKDLTHHLGEVVRDNKKIHLHTANVDHIVIASKDYEFAEILKNAEIVIADGMPIVWYSKILKKRLPERVTGVDLAYKMCETSRENNFKMFLLGAAEGIGELATEKMRDLYPNVEIVGSYSPKKEEINDEEKSIQIIKKINNSGANVLLVALGAPKQEFWISKYKDALNTNINIGVGATIDFMAGNVKRAPMFYQKYGLEWMYRLFQEPKRMFKRYIINDSSFIILVIKDYIYYQRKRADKFE